MKNKPWIVGLLILVLSFLSTGVLLSQSQKPQLFFRFHRNTAFSSAGDFGAFITQNDPAQTARSSFQGFGGEIGLETKKHAFGIQVGYLERYLDIVSLTQAGPLPPAVDRHSFFSVPIFLFIRYKVVNRSFFNLSLTLGEGIYLARYQEKNGETVLLKSKKNSLGFHGGITIDLHIFKFLAIYVDAGYRLVSFKEMVGKDYQTAGTPLEGDLYYQANESTGEYGFLIKQNSIPGSRPAVLDLNGFTLQAGVKILL